VAIADTKSGHILYQYGNAGVCMRGLPPCSTFKIANSLIGLDLGVVTPRTVFKWDGRPEPVKAWETDSDMAKAFKYSIVWWYQRVAAQVGHDRYVERLKAFDYGDHDPSGPVTEFWLGPKAGGGLLISTHQQINFLKRFYAGQLPVKPASAAYVRQIMVDETRNDAQGRPYVMSGKTGSCASIADGSRSVGWWVGRLQGPDRDLLFAASVEAADAPPGGELRQRIKDVFSDAGLWPAGT
jgi:beta-lactamase class D